MKREVVPTIVEAVLEQNGAALIRDEGMYRIVPLGEAEAASSSPTVGRYPSSRTTGYGIQVVPLAHVSAAEIEKILGPLVPEGSSMRVDTARNLLLLSGPKYRLEELAGRDVVCNVPPPVRGRRVDCH